MHSTDDLNDGYLGSGKFLWRSIAKHGKETHQLTILEYLPDRASLRKRENEIVNGDLLKDPLCMNLCEGGSCNWDYSNRFGLSPMNNPERRTEENLPHLKEIWEASGRRLSKMSREHPEWRRNAFMGKSHSTKTKSKMSNSMKGKLVGDKNGAFETVWISTLDDMSSKRVPKNEAVHLVENGWKYGRKCKKKTG
jgi:hypothetical protein